MNNTNINNQVFDLVKKIAPLLPGQWRLNQIAHVSDDVFLIGEGGMKIYFREHFDKPTMINVTGSFPSLSRKGKKQQHNDLRYWDLLKRGDSYPTMNFSSKRKLTSIVYDLKKRFLDRYIELYRLAEIKKCELLEKRILISHQVTALELVAPVERSVHDFSEDNPRLYLSYGKKELPNGEVFFNTRSKIDLKITDLSMDTAIKLLALISSDVKNNKK